MTQFIKVWIVAFLCMTMLACSKKSEAPNEVGEVATVTTADVSASKKLAGAKEKNTASDDELKAASKVQQLSSNAMTYTYSERKFIRSASLQFAVKDVYQSALALEDMVAAHAGFVIKNNITSTPQMSEKYPNADGNIVDIREYAVSATLIVRVPSQRTQEFLRAITTQIEFLDNRNFEARDAQFELLQQKLNITRLQEQQTALAQMPQKNADVEQRAGVIAMRGETLAMRDESRIMQKKFEDEVAFSTLTLNIYQANKVRKFEYVDVHNLILKNRPGFFPRAASSLSFGWYQGLDLLITLMQVWPLYVLFAAFFFVRRHLNLKRWKRKTPSDKVE